MTDKLKDESKSKVAVCVRYGHAWPSVVSGNRQGVHVILKTRCVMSTVIFKGWMWCHVQVSGAFAHSLVHWTINTVSWQAAAHTVQKDWKRALHSRDNPESESAWVMKLTGELMQTNGIASWDITDGSTEGFPPRLAESVVSTSSGNGTSEQNDDLQWHNGNDIPDRRRTLLYPFQQSGLSYSLWWGHLCIQH